MYVTKIGANGLPISLSRCEPFDVEAGFHQLAGLWLYGNWRLLYGRLACVPLAFGPDAHSSAELSKIDAEAKDLILQGRILVSGIHNLAHRRVVVAALGWCSPFIAVLSGGIRHHLGPELDRQPFPAGRLWRHKWDALSDLAVSRRGPDKLPTFASHNRTVDRMIEAIAAKDWLGLPSLGEQPPQYPNPVSE